MMDNDLWFFLFGGVLITLLAVGGQIYVAKRGHLSPKCAVLAALIISTLMIVVGAVLRTSFSMMIPFAIITAFYTIWVLLLRYTLPRK